MKNRNNLVKLSKDEQGVTHLLVIFVVVLLVVAVFAAYLVKTYAMHYHG